MALNPDPAQQDRGPELTVMFWVWFGIAFIFVALRYTARLMIRQTGWDDHMMAFTLLMFLGLSCFSTVMASVGGCKHMAYIEPASLATALKTNWAAQVFMITGYATGKISIGLLILRIIGPNTVIRKWTIYVILGLCAIFSALDIIFTFVQCSPPKALWEPELLVQGYAKCWDTRIQANFAFFLGCWNVFADAFLALIPITIFYKLKLKLAHKISCAALLGLGLLAAICGAIKAVRLTELNARSDLTWETFPLFVWSAGELFVLIVCGSVPPLKTLFDRFLRGRQVGSSASRRYTGHSYGRDDSGLASPRIGGPGKFGSRFINITESEVDSYIDSDRRYMCASDAYEITHIGKGNITRESKQGIMRTTEVSITSSGTGS